jgi:hypothetical protein
MCICYLASCNLAEKLLKHAFYIRITQNVCNPSPINHTEHFIIYNFRLYLHLLLLEESVITLCVVVLYEMLPLNMSERPKYVGVFKYLMYAFVSGILCWFCVLIRVGVLRDLAVYVPRLEG